MSSLSFLVQRILVPASHSIPAAAVDELRRYAQDVPLVTEGAPTPGDVVLVLISHPLAHSLIQAGLTGLHERPVERDGFHVFVHEGILWILGGSPRGVMQGIHALADGRPLGSERQGAFAMNYRIFSPILGRLFFEPPTTPRQTFHSCMRYLSNMGASHVAATHDFAGGPSRDLHAYVESEIFPQSVDPELRSDLRQALRSIIDSAGEFGLSVLFDGRMLPCQGGPWVPSEEREHFLRRYPAECLSDCGTYQGKVLCFGHPLVQAFLEEVIVKFFRDFPEIDLFHYLALDAEGEFCDPHACPRCRGLNKFDQRDRLSRFLERIMTRERPGIHILNTSFQWDRDPYGFGQMIARQKALPPAVGLCLPATGDSATFERQSHALLREARTATNRAGQLVIGRDALHAFEDCIRNGRQLFDYPRGIFAKVRRWSELGFDGFYDIRGRMTPEDLHANGPACRAALLDPQTDPSTFCEALALRWFGNEAGPLVAKAWSLLERAQAMISNGYSFNSSSLHSQYVAWHFRIYPPIPTDPAFSAKLTFEQANRELPPAPAHGYTYRDGDYPTRLRTTGISLLESAPFLKQAADLIAQASLVALPSQFIDEAVWLGSETPLTPQSYLEYHQAFLENCHYFNSAMGPFFILRGLRLKHGEDVDAYRREGAEMLELYIQTSRTLADYLDALIAAGRNSEPYSKAFTPEALRQKAADVSSYLEANPVA